MAAVKLPTSDPRNFDRAKPVRARIISETRCLESCTIRAPDSADMTNRSRHTGCYAIVRNDLLFTMSDNTPNRLTPEGQSTTVRIHFLTDEHSSGIENRSAKHRWGSQTGSNRRPPACKAGALPTELWPRSAVNQLKCPPPLTSHYVSPIKADTTETSLGEGWWAWEDLNFRPHAYQARALTN